MWLATQIKSKELYISTIAYKEVNDKYPECSEWLKENKIRKIVPDNDITNISLEIKNLLSICNDDYHKKGVDEKDIFIIAVAKKYGLTLISNEANQLLKLPDIRKKYKIPAVCALPEVKVPCINFLEYFKQSGKVF